METPPTVHPVEVGAVTIGLGTLLTLVRQLWNTARKVGEVTATVKAHDERIVQLEVARDTSVSRSEVTALEKKMDALHTDVREIGRRIDALLLRGQP